MVSCLVSDRLPLCTRTQYYITGRIDNDNPANGMGCYTWIREHQGIPPGFLVTHFYLLNRPHLKSQDFGSFFLFEVIKGVVLAIS